MSMTAARSPQADPPRPGAHPTPELLSAPMACPPREFPSVLARRAGRTADKATEVEVRNSNEEAPWNA